MDDVVNSLLWPHVQRPCNLLHLPFAVELLHQGEAKLDGRADTLAGHHISVHHHLRAHGDRSVIAKPAHQWRIAPRLIDRNTRAEHTGRQTNFLTKQPSTGYLLSKNGRKEFARRRSGPVYKGNWAENRTKEKNIKKTLELGGRVQRV